VAYAPAVPERNTPTPIPETRRARRFAPTAPGTYVFTMRRSGCSRWPEYALDKGAAVLSRGERQRLLLFCTLVLGRRVVVLDEPFSAFDPLQLEKVQLALRCVTRAGGAILASIHQLTDAEQIADRVLLLAQGRALAFGTLAELRAEAGEPQMTLREVFLTLLTRSAGTARTPRRPRAA
jgi:ABC-type multidrug transport system ATPase subunit